VKNNIFVISFIYMYDREKSPIITQGCKFTWWKSEHLL